MQSFFVSSTFKDMQGERDALHRLVMPRLREKAREQGESIQFVDLRWGISTTDMDSDEGAEKILEVCLDEIRQCKPYMIVLLGERYGWMPSPELLRGTAAEKNFSLESCEMSVTELEIQYGMYLASGELDRCVFCLRGSVPSADMTEEQKNVYLAASEEDRVRMERLREKIRNTPGTTVLEYGLEWDSGSKDFTGYDRFADRLADTLETMLAPHWQARRDLSWQERQREEDKLVIDMHQASFVGRERELNEITEEIQTHQVVILEGEGGCGKSALMAALLKRQQENGVKAEMFCCGNSTHCMSAMQLMRLINWELNRFEGKRYRQPEDEQQWREYYNKRLAVYQGPKAVFFIDAIDQLAPDNGLYESWFVPPRLPPNVKLVISTTGAVRVNPAALPTGKQGVSSQICRLTAPDAEDLRDILNARFLAEHKQVSRRVADKLLENPCSKNMLGMEIMVRRLVMLGKKDFDEIAALEKTMDGNEAIDEYLLKLAQQMSQDLNQLIIDYMDTVCTFLDKDRFVNMQIPLYIIALMQHGISASQMEQFYQLILRHDAFKTMPEDAFWWHFWDPVCFARMKRYLGSLMIQRTDGRVDYSHRLIREALCSRQGCNNIAPLLLVWLLFEPQEDVTRLENMLVICRRFIDSERHFDPNYQIVSDYMEGYFQGPIRDAGNLENDPDPVKTAEGKRQLEILQRSILTDLRGEDGWQHLDTYCDILDAMIRDNASPNKYAVWFMGIPFNRLLERQGEREQAMALQLLCRLIASLHAQKEVYEAGEEKFADNWTLFNKKRLLVYHVRAMRMLAELRVSRKQGVVKLGRFYDLTRESIFEKGIALADECNREKPEDPAADYRKSLIYMWRATETVETLWGRKSNKQTRWVEAAMQCAEDMLSKAQKQDEKTQIQYWDNYIYTASYCVQALTQVYKMQVIGNKTMLKQAIALCEQTSERLDQSGYKEKVDLEVRARLALAWGRCLVMRDAFRLVGDYVYKAQAVDVLCDFYYPVRKDLSREIKPVTRDLLAKIAVEIGRLVLSGHIPKVMEADGYKRRPIARFLLEKEGSYLQAQARSDFASRWRWAVMLCVEAAYHNHLDTQKSEEACEHAMEVLKQLKKDNQKGDTEVFDADIDAYIAYIGKIQSLNQKAKEQAK